MTEKLAGINDDEIGVRICAVKVLRYVVCNTHRMKMNDSSMFYAEAWSLALMTGQVSISHATFPVWMLFSD